MPPTNKRFGPISLGIITLALGLAWWAGRTATTVWVVEAIELEQPGEQHWLPLSDSLLWPLLEGSTTRQPPVLTEQVVIERESPEGDKRYYELRVQHHYGPWSLLPPAVTLLLCFVMREPLSALLGGILVGIILLPAQHLAGLSPLPGYSLTFAAMLVLLYLVGLGGLLGLWSRNGAAHAFAASVTRLVVRGPRTAKLSAWLLGIFFFQGGSLSTLLVGTTVKPIADQEKISHEELSYIVDSTASPISILIPFNAWPLYVQGLIYIGGVTALASEAARVQFFFGSVPLFFYAMLAVLFTLLLSLDRLPFISPGFRRAIRRARETGQLDRPGAQPMQATDLAHPRTPPGYRPVAWEFFLPLAFIPTIALGTHLILGSLNLLWAFAGALALAYLTSTLRGFPLRDLPGSFATGLKAIAYGGCVLLLAIMMGAISRESGGGLYLIEALGSGVTPLLLPAILFLLTAVIAFATGTSWGTFAIALPLAMPLAWATGTDLTYPLLYLQICFASVINGSVFGDHCSPISDTSVLSSLATGCDLMDHITTQITPSAIAALIALLAWTLLTFFLI